ncbi:endonuclease/exonuclease/phosphatase family protein [Actinomyces gerencseriae]
MLRLLSLNIQHALPGAGADEAPGPGVADADIRDPTAARSVLAALAEQIHELSPDVVALQEVDTGQARSGFLDQTAVLAELLGWESHRFAAAYAGPVAGLRRRPRRSALTEHADDALGLGRALLGRPPAGFGNALLARHPVTAWRVRRLGRGPATVSRRGDHPIWDPRGYDLATSTMRNLLTATLALAPADPGPHLLAGDYNLRTEELVPLGIGRQVGEGPTYPAARPDHRIDHVLTDPWPTGVNGAPAFPVAPAPVWSGRRYPLLRATAWGTRTFVVSDHAGTWVDLEPVG